VRTGVTLTVGREATVDFTLQVGAVAERITVTGEAPMIETTNATVASLVDQATMKDLPLNGRSFADLTSLQAGVVSDLEVQTPGYNIVYSGGGPAVRRSIGGAKPQQSTYLLDGMEVSSPSVGTPASSVVGQQLGVDAIREFTVLQSNYGAQYGRAAGGVVNAVTQSGTNEFHGTVFHFLRNSALDARDYFLSSALPKAPFKQNQFGGALGGPIKKDKTFFFANYEGVRFAAGEPFLGPVYTPETRVGRITNAQGKVTSTVTVSPEVQHIIKAIPSHNGDYLDGGVAYLSGTYPWHGGENYGITRIDQQLTDKDSLFGRFTKDVSSREDRMALEIPGGFIGQQAGGYVLGAVSWTRIISSTVINTARTGYTRRNDHIGYNYTNEGEFFPKGHPDLDPRWSIVPGTPISRMAPPQVDIYGQVGPRAGGPARFTDNTFDYDDSVLINRAGHSLTVGGNLKRYQSNTRNEPWAQSGPSWNSLERFLTNRPFDMTITISNPAPGVITYNDSYRGWRQTYGSFYLQDDFQVRPGLTLNLGVRWERLTGLKEVNGKISQIKNLFTDPVLRS
ncbi:MAG: TonB-dependent receptor plug domain-containing protein, partial [Acidobacteria bacterium]|nr:TonB-dependent receptor plug domain-containing protein [Acidobacteriota bacterium]